MKRQIEGEEKTSVEELTKLFGVVSTGEKYVDISANEKDVQEGTDIPHKLKLCVISPEQENDACRKHLQGQSYRNNSPEGGNKWLTSSNYNYERAISTLIYHSPNEYYLHVSKNHSYQGHPWSEIEEVALLAIGSTYSYAGGWRVFKPETVDTYILYEAGWKRIKKILDGVMSKWSLINNVEAPPERSWEELALHVKVLKGMTWCEENRYYFIDIRYKWFNQYNIDNIVFDPSILMNPFRDNCDLVNQNFEKIRDEVGFLYNDATIRNRPWSEKEEILLVGVTEDHTVGYILRGGSCYSVNWNTTLAKRVAIEMKQQYDIAWQNAIKTNPRKFSKIDFKERSVEELRDQYVLIKYRTACELDRHLADNIGLVGMWYKINKDGQILNSRVSSMCAKPDGRYNFEYFNNKDDDGSAFIDSLIEMWDEIQSSKQSNNDQNDAVSTAESIFDCSGLNNPVNIGKSQSLSLPALEVRIQKKKRSNNWTFFEELSLYGIIREYRRSKLIKDSPNNPNPHRKLNFSWANVARTFSMVLERHHSMYHSGSNYLSHNDRSPQTLKTQFVNIVQHMKDDITYENKLLTQWSEKFNLSSSLLCAADIHVMFSENPINKYNKKPGLEEDDAVNDSRNGSNALRSITYNKKQGLEEDDAVNDSRNGLNANIYVENESYADDTMLKENLLFGILVELFLANGVVTDYTHLYDEVSPDQMRWKWALCVYDVVWNRWCKIVSVPNTNQPYGSDWEELGKSFHRMIRRLPEEPFLFYDMYIKWSQQYNRDYNLLHPDDFDKHALKSGLPFRTAYFNAANLQEEASSATYSSNRCGSSNSRGSKVPSRWRVEEEAILIGAVLDWVLSRGLVSSAFHRGNGGTDCWDKIRTQFHMARSKYFCNQSNLKPRTSKALYTYYKRIRRVRGYEERNTEFRIVKLYEKWSVLNKDGVLLPRAQSLCATNPLVGEIGDRLTSPKHFDLFTG